QSSNRREAPSLVSQNSRPDQAQRFHRVVVQNRRIVIEVVPGETGTKVQQTGRRETVIEIGPPGVGLRKGPASCRDRNRQTLRTIQLLRILGAGCVGTE